MRQLLMLGFYCEVYRREPRCRVYVNDVMVDEFDISHTSYKQVDIVDNPISPHYFGREIALLTLHTPFLKYIELDNLGAKADIKIEIQNNDNNYNNGFMTKNTQLLLLFVFLSSEKLLNSIDVLKKNWKFNKENYNIQNKRDIKIFYSNSKNLIFENLARYMSLNFPDSIKQQKLPEEIKPYCGNWQDLPTQYIMPPNLHQIGTSGYFHLTLKKKLGFWKHSTDRRKGRWRVGQMNSLVKELYDKYKQYEDQRSSNT